MRYQITREFIGGNLCGLTHTGTYSSPMAVGKVVKKPCGGGSPYRILSCIPQPDSAEAIQQLLTQLKETLS